VSVSPIDIEYLQAQANKQLALAGYAAELASRGEDPASAIAEVRRIDARINGQLETRNSENASPDPGRDRNGMTADDYRANDEHLAAEAERARAAQAGLEALKSRLPGGKSLRGNAVAPLAFDEQELRQMHEAIQNHQPRSIRAQRGFNSVDANLPAQLWPQVIGTQHDNRILDRIPTFPMDGPYLQYIRHTSTSGAPAPVAIGGQKPELTFTTDHPVAVAVKLAAHAGVPWEDIQDWSTWFSYVQTELMAQVVDIENDQLLNADPNIGTTPTLAIEGFLATPGVLTHATSTDTPLDSLELAITALRTGAAKATADLLILHPSTWSAVRRSKDGQNRYLTQADPTQGEANTVWGVDVLTTTQLAAGKGVLLDTQKFGRALVREPLNLRVGYDGTDFSHNIVRTIAEERITLAVERPAAVCSITGLPTS
jgi:HK97 family phage major capsid protein